MQEKSTPFRVPVRNLPRRRGCKKLSTPARVKPIVWRRHFLATNSITVCPYRYVLPVGAAPALWP